MSVRKLPDGRWEARARVDGRHLKKVFDRKADAAAWEAKTMADRDRGIHVDMSNRVTVAEYFQQWMDMRVLRDSSRARYDTLRRIHLEPLPLGSRPVVKVRPSEIQAWVRGRSEVLSPQTLRHSVGVLRSAFAAAVLDGVIVRNPVQPIARMSLPKEDKPKFVPLTVPQVQAWADAAEPRVRAMILAQAGLGLRIGELLALRVQDVDFLRREVHITEQVGRTGHRAPLKTANSRRVVPLPQVTAEVLAGHIQAYPPAGHGYLFAPGPLEAADKLGRRRPSGRPRSVTQAGTWTSQRVFEAYRNAARAAGLPDGTTSHDLRHHCASVLLDAGETIYAVAEQLGDRAEMVVNVYGHLMPDKEETRRRAIDNAWRAAQETARDERPGQDHP